ncbi:MAG: hypothetical protein KAH32_07035, partial [Chlamydiia bacterium]|nr:hypothetical protein [Chlamydiia bacterium]
ESDTGILERGFNSLFSGVADIWDKGGLSVDVNSNLDKYVDPLNEDVTVEVKDGKRYVIDNKTFNDTPIDQLKNEILNLNEDVDARDMLYYDRIDNPDGTVSYKLGTTKVDNYDRYRKNNRRNDVTNLWAVRSNKAKEYEKLWHGNKHNLKNRRSALGSDEEKFGAGYTEIYNEDGLSLDGTVSSDKLHTLNTASQEKLHELGLNVQDRYDTRGIASAYKELDKMEAIYGTNSSQFKDLRSTLSNVEQINRLRDLSYTEGGLDLLSASVSGAQQFIAGTADAILDFIVPGDSTLLNTLKNTEYADDVWNYESRGETARVGAEALRKFKKGDYAESLFTASTVANDVIAQSLADMGGMAIGRAKTLLGVLNPAKNVGLAAFAAKQTNNQIDDRVENNRINGIEDPEGVGVGTILGMYGSNYYLGALDSLAFRGSMSNVTAPLESGLLSILPQGALGNITAATLSIAGSLARAGATEASQELLQSYGEAVNSKYGTHAYEGKGLLSTEFVDEAIQGALLGFGAGVVMNAGTMPVDAATGK